ncbi:polysaccharide deacetylase [Salicibibacter cibarius]|uniref:Polysaccharide deacetylase n=1 Tax=Salicibibacter cibarius TaxID=2743000 RepID=A0A7T7CD54_9BACI|nr:polysaccharide deacetylase family protein [Salicibibacter cibarius]QQK77644.1 polysaccharide deacetylase [Salicibibacter cibarius]
MIHRLPRLNKNGKIAASVLLIVGILIVSGLFGGRGDADEKNDFPSLEAPSAETLSVSFDTMPSFEDSNLHTSIQQEENDTDVEEDQSYQQDGVIYLTFDDGPSEATDKLLDILDDYNMKATFFMLGPDMKENPEAVKRTHKQGFGLALHGMTHDKDEIYSHASAPTDEMIETQEILEDITGEQSDIIRLPYGSSPYLTEDMRTQLDQNDFQIWDWNVDSQDWELKDERYVQHTIQEIEQMEQEGETPVVLLHDKQETVDHLPELLSYIKEQGYQTEVLDSDMAPLTFS